MDLDIRIWRRDGEIRILHCRAAATMGPDGSARRLDGTCVDVTDRRRAESRLAEAQRFAQLGSWDLDVGRDEITWSREMYRIFGEDPEHFVPTNDLLTTRVVEEDLGPLTEQSGRARARRRLRLVRPHPAPRRGDPRRPLPRHDGAGPPGEGAPARDLPGPDRRPPRRGARAEAVERFRSVFERAPIGIALLARDGRFTLANEAMAEFLGRARRRAARLARRRRHPSRRHAGDARGAAADGRGRADEWNAEKRYVRPSGEIRWGACGRCSSTTPTAAPSTAWRSSATSPTSGCRSGAAPRSTASRGSWPAARRCARRCRRWSRRSCASSTGSAARCGWSTRTAGCARGRLARRQPAPQRRRCPPSRRRPARASPSPS